MIDTTSHLNAQPIDFVPDDRLYLSSPTRPVVAEHLRFRAARLSWAIPAVEKIVRHHRRWGLVIPDAVWPLYANAMVELSQIRGELGVTDDTWIERLADTLESSDPVARALWDEKKATAEANASRQNVIAHHRLETTGTAKIWHVPLVELMDIAVALNLSVSKKQEIFAKGVKTGLPTVNPATGPSFRGDWARVPYTLAQLKDWCRRLGFAPDTISGNARKLSAEEFHARIAKREAALLPPSRLEGRKLAGESDWHASKRIAKEGPKTRKRAFCVTAARREYAKAFGCSERTSITRTNGLDAAQVVALVDERLSLKGPICTDKDVRVCTDKSQKIGHFPLTDVSGNVSQGVETEACSEGSSTARKVTRHKRERYGYVYAYGGEEGLIIHRWHEAKRGRELTEEAARKWHERGTFEKKFFEACEWIVAQDIPDDEDGNNPEKDCAAFWLDAYRTQDRKRRASKRSSKLMPAWMRAYAKACEEGAETMFEITPAPAVAEAA
ncbi:hypothetical protein [Methylorubrum thiocyanatum]|uniref:Uncharacterized protein n=1 Tax=Methylorubrum thiocyanatum TaxID=47958 RepID=A0AA40S7N4_9HYPH|nr:hypothetical protein [Methylorubrum thiocyanatum]MBA8916009.1 hypothetical protein [Methylorubrum thiocyanatum]GJE80907.1 hypothetical protein CJNNKLLH_2248 [Methylorubrum thiocyanatum]